MVFHCLNRSVARLTLFEKDEDYAAFERVLEECAERVPLRGRKKGKKEKGSGLFPSEMTPFYCPSIRPVGLDAARKVEGLRFEIAKRTEGNSVGWVWRAAASALRRIETLKVFRRIALLVSKGLEMLVFCSLGFQKRTHRRANLGL